MQEFLSYLIPGIMTGFVYSVIALGFVLIFKSSGVLNLAQGEMVIIGAYIFYAIATQMGLPIWVGVLGTLIILIIFGLLIERVVMRPLIGQPILSVILITLAIAGILDGIMIAVWGPNVINIPRLFPSGGLTFIGVTVSYSHLCFMGLSLLMLGGLLAFFRFTSTGLAMTAVADDQQAAQSTGIKVSRVLAITWAVTAVVSGIGGILLATITGVHYSNVGIGLSAIAVVLVGGLQSVGGVILAGPLVGAVQGVTAGYLDPIVGASMTQVTPYIVLMIVLMIRPSGFFGWKRIERV
jgi:branched-chain amino acid transport system permease protein